MTEREAGEMSEREVDESIAESFPASDPPSWTLGTDHRKPVDETDGTDRTDG